MTLLSQLEQDTVVYGLNILEALLTKRNLAKGKDLGTWGWGLLARCRPVGEMGSEEVGILRSLGKTAVWLLRGMMAGREEDGRAEEEVDDLMEEKAEGHSAMGLGKVQQDRNQDLPEKEEPVEDNLEPPDVIQGDVLPSTPDTSGMDLLERPQGQMETASDTSDPLDQARQRLLSSLTQPSSSKIASDTPINGTTSPLGELMSDEPPPVIPEDVFSKKQGNEKDSNIQIYATLDMIVTVVGEFYGQRDLLNGRVLWDEM